MANFQTHLGGAAIGGGLLLTGALVTEVLTLNETIAGWLLVMIGGVLPDIDSDHSKVVRGMFTTLAAGCAVLSVITLAEHLPILGLWIAGIMSFVIIRYGCWYLFTRFTVHRGIFHSLLAGCLFAVFVTAVAYQIAGLSEQSSWLMGFSLLAGYLIHLLLDECYSVDLSNVRVKRSFGTALKLFDYKNWSNSVLMGCLLAALGLTVTPPIDQLLPLLSDLGAQWQWQKLWQ